MKKISFIIIIIALLLISSDAYSQKYKWTNYYMEFGVLGGGSYYLGDINDQLFKNVLPSGGVFLKYKFNGHWETKIQTTIGQAGIGYLDNRWQQTAFFDLSAIAEFNFFNYGVMLLEPSASPISPYIFAGLGMSIFNEGIAPVVPFGLGVKYHFAKRFNIGVYFSMQKTLWNDNFDHVNNPLGLNAGIWNNNDWYSTVALYFSIDFWEICPSCRDGRKTYQYNGY